METLDDVTAIVVHHKHFPEVLRTCDLLIRGGVPSGNILIVDNSEDEQIFYELANLTADRFHVTFVKNEGYANAINSGISWFHGRNELKEFLLVSTHEVKPEPNAIASMRVVLRENIDASVVGPTLVSRLGDGERVWSTGGQLSRLLNYPYHLDLGIPVGQATSRRLARRDWLDGSFCLYRSAELVQNRLSEDYFLYLEETDYHSQLRKQGRLVLWCPQAVAQQETNGIPPFLLGRNLQIFQYRHGNALQRMVTVPLLVAKRGLDVMLGKHSAVDWLSIARGWIAGLRYPRQQTGRPVPRRGKSPCASS